MNDYFSKWTFQLLLLFGMVLNASAQMQCVTDVMLIGGSKSEANSLKDTYTSQGWTVIDKDLNDDCGSKTAYIYLLYKTGGTSDAITDFYLRVTDKSDHPETLTYNGRTYYQALGGGTDVFNNSGCDLNHKAGGKYIYLYYTKDVFPDSRTVADIYFNTVKDGAVGVNGGSEGCDLNKGAGGDDIFMHVICNLPPIETAYLADDGTTPTVMATPISSINSIWGTANTETWYTLQGEVNINSRITTRGTVNLILANNTKLNANKGINVPSGSTLHIWAQSEDQSKMGVLNADASSQTGCAGIGGNKGSVAGKIHIHGGYVSGTGCIDEHGGAGIGGGFTSNYEGVTISGGIVVGFSLYGAGIGGGACALCNDIVITNGLVTGGSCFGAGIGSGYNGALYVLGQYSNYPREGSMKTITISGGFVQATSAYGAGLGGGAAAETGYGLLGNLHITGGKVSAFICTTGGSKGSHRSQAIGHGDLENTPDAYKEWFVGETTLYDNAKVMADDVFLSADNRTKVMRRYSEGNHFNKVEISPCDHDGATYTNNGDGTHTINCTYCLGGTEPHDSYVFLGGSYVCNKCYAEKEDEVEVCDIALFTYDGSVWKGLNYPVTKGGEYTLPSRNDITNLEFVGWGEVASLPSSLNPLMDSDETVLYPGTKVTMDADKMFAARYRPTSLTLAGNASNEHILANNFNCTRTITLADRTLRKDGTWNTLCLPFNVKDRYDGDNITFSGTPLQGAVVKKLESAVFANGKLTLVFSSDQATIEAGMPYIVKWARPDDYVAYDGSNAGTCSDVVNPVFSDVTITSLMPSTVSCEAASIIGIYNPYNISGEDNTILYLGTDNKLYYPDDAMTIGSMGAYLLLANGITATEGGLSNLTIPDLELSSVSLTLAVESRNTLEVTSGSGSYSVVSSNDAVATAMIDNSIITVTGISDGQAVVTVTDAKSGKTATIQVDVAYHCPDERHPHMVDLGLPSGTKWACCNVGANTPEAYGNYYAWGETNEKWDFSESTYQYFKNGSYVNIGDDIAGTRYDVARVKWGGSWMMPTLDQFNELCSCTSRWTTFNGVKGRRITGPNGRSIFLPASGYFTEFPNFPGYYGHYWSSALSTMDSGYAQDFIFSSSGASLWDDCRYEGRTVRPVSK